MSSFERNNLDSDDYAGAGLASLIIKGVISLTLAVLGGKKIVDYLSDDEVDDDESKEEDDEE